MCVYVCVFVCECVCACVCMYGYHIAVAIKPWLRLKLCVCTRVTYPAGLSNVRSLVL